MGSLIRFSVLTPILAFLLVPTLLLKAQDRDYRAERIVLDDDNGNTIVIQTTAGPITGGTLTIPDPGGAGQFLISNPAGGSQSVSGDLLPGADDTYDLGSGASRWQDIFAAGDISLGGQLQFVETGGGTDYVGFQAPAAVAASQVWTLPAADGTIGQALVTDGAGVLSWAAAGGGGAAGGDLTGTYPNPTIANDAVTSAKIQDGQVQNGDISANAITTSKVANGTVTTSKMADSAISGLKLLTFAVTNRHLAAAAVTPDKVSSTGAASGNVLTYNGTNVAWAAPAGGGLATTRTDVAVGSGNVTLNGTGQSFIRINASTGAFNVVGISGGVDGQLLVVYNMTANIMVVSNQDVAEATAANRVATTTAANLNALGPGGASVLLIYDGNQSRWVNVGGYGT